MATEDLYGWHDVIENPNDTPPEGTKVICRCCLPEQDKYIYGTGRFENKQGWRITVNTDCVPVGPVKDGSVLLVGWAKKKPQLWMESRRRTYKDRFTGEETPWTIEVRSHDYIEKFIDGLREEAQRDDGNMAYDEAADELEQLLLELRGEKPFYNEEDENGNYVRKEFRW